MLCARLNGNFWNPKLDLLSINTNGIFAIVQRVFNLKKDCFTSSLFLATSNGTYTRFCGSICGPLIDKKGDFNAIIYKTPKQRLFKSQMFIK